jgi:sec-independent protein translocase protein TatA
MTDTLLLLFLPSGSEWIYILLAILLLFGGKKIPELMKGLGKGVKSFKDGINEAKDEINKTKDEIESDETKSKEEKEEKKGDGKQ